MNTIKQNQRESPGGRTERYRYGVFGLSEWVALIPVGKAKLRVRFSGGETSGFGRVPAEFVTTDPTVARLIQESDYFRQGRIKRLFL